MIKTINDNINKIVKEKGNYKIINYKNKIVLFNNINSILLYYLGFYTNSFIKSLFFIKYIKSYYIKKNIIKIEKDIAYYGNVNNDNENNFWNNLNKIVIIYSNDMEDHFKRLINKEDDLIIFVNENNFLNKCYLR